MFREVSYCAVAAKSIGQAGVSTGRRSDRRYSRLRAFRNRRQPAVVRQCCGDLPLGADLQLKDPFACHAEVHRHALARARRVADASRQEHDPFAFAEDLLRQPGHPATQLGMIEAKDYRVVGRCSVSGRSGFGRGGFGCRRIAERQSGASRHRVAAQPDTGTDPGAKLSLGGLDAFALAGTARVREQPAGRAEQLPLARRQRGRPAARHDAGCSPECSGGSSRPRRWTV